jgi:hypothetical protein
VDFEFEHVEGEGAFYCDFSLADEMELDERINSGEIEAPDFTLVGTAAQFWELEFDGEYSGSIILKFAYDSSLLPEGYDEMDLDIFHFTGGNWEAMEGVVDPVDDTITVTTNSLSPFMLGEAVPEPSSAAMLALGGLLLGGMNRRGRSRA